MTKDQAREMVAVMRHSLAKALAAQLGMTEQQIIEQWDKEEAERKAGE